MKIGAENKKEVAIMGVLLAALLVVGVYNFRDVLWGSSAAEPPSPPASSGPQQKGPGTIAAAQDNEPSLITDVLQRSREVKYEAGGRNIFQMEAVKIEPVGPVRPPTPEAFIGPMPTPSPPPPPKIPLVFYGFANKPGEPKRVFLAPDNKSDQNFVAGLNEIVDRRYKIVQIQNNQIVVEDMLNNNRQSIPLTPRP
jgi:hypothetical protein